jgi:hypothetical protein
MNLRLVSLIVPASVCFLGFCAAGQTVPPKPAPPPIVYRNTRYDFCFTLPASWHGYKIVADEWGGGESGDEKETVPLHRPEITIVHPLWTAENERPDIPILIMTPQQWHALKNGEFSIGASGADTRAIARNAHYVFVLPPRFYLERASAIREVGTLIDHRALQAPCPAPRGRN